MSERLADELRGLEPGQRVQVRAELSDTEGCYIGHIVEVTEDWPLPVAVIDPAGEVRRHTPWVLEVLPFDCSPAAVEEWLES